MAEEAAYNETLEELSEIVEEDIEIWYFVEEGYIFLCCLVTIVLNASTAFCLIKFRDMHSRMNTLMASICIGNVLLALVHPEFLLLLRIALGSYRYYTFFMFCYVFDLYPLVLTVCAAFYFATTVDALFAKSNARPFRLIVAIVWLFLFSGILVNTLLCSLRVELFPFYIFLFLLSVALIVIKYCIYLRHVVRKTATRDEHYRMTVAGFYAFSLILTFLVHLVGHFFRFTIIYHISRVLVQFYYLQPLVFVVVLTRFDDNIRMCLSYLYNCRYNYIQSAIRYKRDGDDLQDLAGNEVETNDVSQPV